MIDNILSKVSLKAIRGWVIFHLCFMVFQLFLFAQATMAERTGWMLADAALVIFNAGAAYMQYRFNVEDDRYDRNA